MAACVNVKAPFPVMLRSFPPLFRRTMPIPPRPLTVPPMVLGVGAATQLPALHRLPLPHIVPSGTFVPTSLHTGVPDEQACFPWWHTLDGVHGPASAHGAPR